MSSLRYQKITSWNEHEKLRKRILAKPMNPKTKAGLLNELDQYGRRAVPDVAKRFKRLTRNESSPNTNKA
jgi:hypothetical protein